MGLVADIQKDLEKGALRLVAEYRDRLYAEAVRLCRDCTEAEDLVSMTFDKAIRNIDSLMAEENLFEWMKKIMRNLLLNQHRNPVTKGTRPVDSQALDELAGTSDDTIEEILAHSDHDALRTALAKLDPEYKKTLVMHYFSELPVKNIALALNLPLGTVLWRLNVARKMLANDLGKRIGKKPVAIVAVLFFTLASAFGAWKAADALGWLPASEEPQVVESPSADSRGGAVWGGAVSAPQNKETAISQENKGSTDMNLKQVTKLAAVATVATALTVPAARTANADDIGLTIDRSQQRYPWNGYVDIDYTITRDPDSVPSVDDNLDVLMIDKSVTPAVTNRAIRFLQAPLPMTAGKHRITWDANGDGVTNYTERASFVLKIVHYAPAYMVVDVSGGPDAETYPVDFLNGEPLGGFNVPEYKGDKIVLRRIRPGSYMAGSPSTEANRNAAREAQHRVAITKPFYIGLFEVTQKQYFNVTGADPSKCKGDERPVEQVSWTTIRGAGDWPNSTAVSDSSFMGILRAKCKSKGEDGNYTEPVMGFDLPTEFQWEYACRAGTTGAFNTTNAYDNAKSSEQEAQLKKLGRYLYNPTDGHGDYNDTHTTVGSYEPNLWGLYDMHGNALEWCLDKFKADVQELAQYVDPVGVTTPSSGGSQRAIRGGSCQRVSGECRSAFRDSYNQGLAFDWVYLGFRLSRTLP